MPPTASFRVPGAFDGEEADLVASPPSHRTLILSLSLSSTTTKLASLLSSSLPALDAESHSLNDYDLDALLLSTPRSPVRTLVFFVIPSYNVESPVDSLLAQLSEAVSDFRVASDTLSGVVFAVLGVGHRDYGAEFGKQAKEVDGYLGRLGGRRLASCQIADVSTDPEEDFRRYARLLDGALANIWGDLEKVPVAAEAGEEPSDGEGEEPMEDGVASSKAQLAKRKALLRARGQRRTRGEGESPDIEEIGAALPSTTTAPRNLAVEGSEVVEMNKKEMVSPMMRKALTKQGYALVGSHSGVKTCRWTKASLRGRGFCYKHAFYGIMSHRCMEATPSLACANKCTFCWRSHTNPVGTSWRWATDDPEFLVTQSLAAHDKLIAQLKGMPGVREERFEEARTPRHAALSLVGEPVMYPHIYEYIRLLTQKKISTFLVTNAQFPEALGDLPPVTQLYLSIDAGTKESLKAIDRPLHRDFWERFLASIDIVRRKRVRSVFRLTLVKGQNDSPNDIAAYASLVRRGRPDFIEVKGVTFCGYGGSAGLSIKNSPFHNEVKEFVEGLCDEVGQGYEGEYEDGGIGEGYGLAAEHAHSCCVLAARKDYYNANTGWNTWINYDRFFELVERGKPFGGLDFAAPTPGFALYGSAEAGFSPEDERWFRKGKGDGGGS